jgi:hypothetical protein
MADLIAVAHLDQARAEVVFATLGRLLTERGIDLGAVRWSHPRAGREDQAAPERETRRCLRSRGARCAAG